VLIGVDIDGVIFPWERAVVDAVEFKFGVSLGELTTWDTYELALGPERWEWLWTPEGTDAVLSQTWRTYPGIVPAIRGLFALGHQVHFVTHRDPARCGGHTAAFLARHFGGLRWAGLHVTRSSVAKRTLGRWDVFVDDKPETVFDFLANTGAMVFAPVRPWNADELADVGVEGLTNLVHYADPAEILAWVEARS
jgi:hypothetical protein